MSTLESAAAQMRASGLPEFPAGHPRVNVGKFTRYGPRGKAYYKLSEVTGRKGQAMVFGTYGFKGDGPHKIEADYTPFDAEERERFVEQQREAEEREKRAIDERARLSAMRGAQQWETAHRAGPWPYLERKQITPEGVRSFSDGRLLVPVYRYPASLDAAAELVGLQKIAADGGKLFNKGMHKRGHGLELGVPVAGAQEALVLVAVGYAPARSIRMAVKERYVVVVAFDAGNLAPVARSLRKRYPQAHILFAADDDRETEGNPGLSKARTAAAGAGGSEGRASVVIPVFAVTAPGLVDFNDLHCTDGLDVVARQLDVAIAAALDRPSDAVVDAAPPSRPPSPPGRSDGRPPPDDDWQSKLRRDQKGILSSLLNCALILTHDPAIAGVIAKNEFSEAIEKVRAPPYEFGEIGEWTDLDDSRLSMWIEEHYAFSPKAMDLMSAVLEVADRHRFHPLRDWLSGLKHDGVPRLREWMIDWLGAPSTEYTRLVSQKFLVMAVARIMKPGCKADNVTILEGRQGLQKSSALKALAGEQYFTDTPIKFGDKETYLLMQGMWLIEMAELDSLSKSEASQSKQFFGQTENHYRPWYAKRPIRVKRQCLFSGSVNDAQYLKDDTGNRRYWPVKCSDIKLPAISAGREQLFAEAVVAYLAGVPWWVLEDERHLFEDEQEERYVGDAYIQRIAAFLDSDKERNEKRWSMDYILEHALKLDMSKWSRSEQMRVGHCLRKLGMERKRSNKPGPRGSREWFYVWPDVPVNNLAAVPEKSGRPSTVSDEEDGAPF
jgi:putative DNA primase/helicase